MIIQKESLQHVLVRIQPGSKVSDIANRIDLLTSIDQLMGAWTRIKSVRYCKQNRSSDVNRPAKGAWTSVKKETIINCFLNCEFKIQVLETFNKSRDFTAEICANLSVDSYLAQDSDKVTSVDFIDKASKTREDYLINEAILFAANRYQIIEGKVKIFLFILNTSPKDFKYSSCNGYCRLSHCFHRT